MCLKYKRNKSNCKFKIVTKYTIIVLILAKNGGDQPAKFDTNQSIKGQQNNKISAEKTDYQALLSNLHNSQ